MIPWEQFCSVDIVAVKPLIEAVGSQASLLVQVKTALSPNTPADISSDELRNINAQAARLGFHSWLAQVVVDSNLRPIGDIAWRKLLVDGEPWHTQASNSCEATARCTVRWETKRRKPCIHESG